MTGGVHNLLLRVLPERERGLLLANAERVAFRKRESVDCGPAGHECVLFVESGMVSVMREAAPGLAAEVGMIGWEGLVGLPALLDADDTLHRYVAQTQVEALRVSAASVRALMASSEAVHALVLRLAHCAAAQFAATAFANAAFNVEARLARWLLMAHDRLPGGDIALTHDMLSTMLSVRRASITLAMHELEGAQAVRGSRGLVTIRDRAKLIAIAGASYGEAEAEYRRLIGATPATGHLAPMPA
ncbi:Crp/Fnr family transcriptional regulator [Alsobacter sp. SYSU M60028]|uniref:Crp/Fnr family transcriptional regulator n=1 Tax=Alsobacter ponti TaxID=2962936 RepID=A0ABT1LGS5_9HYPH|nr:Crp/Fnr family transcriptional regulator [Alsobacter ponti]MCP8940710.1 Crp/Fnr family transcriptional regulator [Alsobacter ponti]